MIEKRTHTGEKITLEAPSRLKRLPRLRHFSARGLRLPAGAAQANINLLSDSRQICRHVTGLPGATLARGRTQEAPLINARSNRIFRRVL